MEKLFAPWRIEYINSKKTKDCIFCSLPKENADKKNLILYRGKLAFAIMNNYPYNPGHVMVAPYRHVASIENLTEREYQEIFKIVNIVLKAIKNRMNPQGFNIGINLGTVAGAGIVDHVHVHIVPRWNGDTNFMPVISEVKVIPQALQETYTELKKSITVILRESP